MLFVSIACHLTTGHHWRVYHHLLQSSIKNLYILVRSYLTIFFLRLYGSSSLSLPLYASLIIKVTSHKLVENSKPHWKPYMETGLAGHTFFCLPSSKWKQKVVTDCIPVISTLKAFQERDWKGLQPVEDPQRISWFAHDSNL